MRGLLIAKVAFLATLATVGFAVRAQNGEVCPPNGGGGISEGCQATAELLLSGTVAPTCAIEVEPTAEATNLNILEGETNTLVATVTEFSNNPAGYEVFVASESGGELTNQETGEAVAYQISYDGAAAVTPTAVSVSVKEVTDAGGGAISDTSEVRISFPAQPDAAAGTYTDTLVFEVAAL